MSILYPCYQSIVDEFTKIASHYSLGSMLDGFSPDLINLLLHNNIDKPKGAYSHEETQKLINASLSFQLGMAVDISSFITTEVDRKKLYELFAAWRLRLLAEIQD